MPITHRFNDEHRLLETHAHGLVTMAELERHLDAEEQEGLVGADELLDARDASTNLTSTQVRHLVQRTDALVNRGRFGDLAIVATDKVAFGMARMYQILCENKPMRVGVFRDIVAARRWLNGSRWRQGTEAI